MNTAAELLVKHGMAEDMEGAEGILASMSEKQLLELITALLQQVTGD